MRPLHGLQRRSHRNRPALTDGPRQINTLTQDVLPCQAQQLALGSLVPILQRLGVLLALGQHLDKAIRDAQEVGLWSAYSPPCENQVSRTADTNQRGKTMCAAGTGDYTQSRLGETDDSVRREDAEMCGEGELEAAPESDGGYGGDGRNGKGGEIGEGGSKESKKGLGSVDERLARLSYVAAT